MKRTLIATAFAAVLLPASAGAAPSALGIDASAATESAATPVFHQGNFGGRRLCYLPFYKLAQRYGPYRAYKIKRHCRWR